MAEKDLHGTALAAEEALEQLATGLAQAGVDEQTVEAVEQCAAIARKVVEALGRGQEQTADDEPPVEEPVPEEPAPAPAERNLVGY